MIGQCIAGELAPVAAEGPLQSLLREVLYHGPRLIGGHADQAAGGEGPAPLLAEGAHDPVGAGHPHPGLHPGGAGLLLGGLDHAVIDRLVIHGGDHVHHLPAHAQQEGHRRPIGEAALVGELVDGPGGAQGIGHAAHRHRAGRDPVGSHGGQSARHPLAVDPDGAQIGVVVIDVVLPDLRQAGDPAVPVDHGAALGEGEGDAPVRTGHKGPLEVGADQGRVVHLAPRHAVPQGRAVDHTTTGGRSQQVIKEGDAVLPGQNLPPAGRDIVQKTYGGRLGQLGVGEGAGQAARVVAQ